jgi:hypothetical protein
MRLMADILASHRLPMWVWNTYPLRLKAWLFLNADLVDRDWIEIRRRAIAGIVLLIILLFSTASGAKERNGWTLAMTFNTNGHRVSLWEKTDQKRAGFKYYAVHNESNIPICIVPRVWGNLHTRTGLQMINLVSATHFHELGFVTYKTGHEPLSAKWVITLFLVENGCSLSHPLPKKIQPEPTQQHRRYLRRSPQSNSEHLLLLAP